MTRQHETYESTCSICVRRARRDAELAAQEDLDLKADPPDPAPEQTALPAGGEMTFPLDCSHGSFKKISAFENESVVLTWVSGRLLRRSTPVNWEYDRAETVRGRRRRPARTVPHHLRLSNFSQEQLCDSVSPDLTCQGALLAEARERVTRTDSPTGR